MLIKTLRDVYRRQSFFPGFLGIFINPFYFARAGLLNSIRELAPNLRGRLLDVGCGSKPYEALFEVDSYVGLEIDSDLSRRRKIADYFYDGHSFPFESASFSSVLSNQVLEHVFNPGEFLFEVNRLLKQDGLLLLTVPFICDEHEQPYDYARYSTFGLRALLESHGFRIVVHNKIGADASTLFQLANFYIFKVTQHLPKYPRFFLTITMMGAINILGIIARKVLPENPDFFLDQIVLAKKVS